MSLATLRRIKSVVSKRLPRRRLLMEHLENRLVLTAQGGLSQLLPGLPGPFSPLADNSHTSIGPASWSGSDLGDGLTSKPGNANFLSDAAASWAGGVYAGSGIPGPQDGPETAAVPGRWITRFDGLGGAADKQLAALRNKFADAGLSGIAVSQALGLPGMVTLETSPDMSFEQLSASLADVSGFRYVAQDYKVWGSALYPNDPLFPELYGLENSGQSILGSNGVPCADISAPDAWDITIGSSSVVVGVIDSGIDFTHPDLINNIWTNVNDPIDGLDGDSNGFVDDVHGWDFWSDDNDPTDENGHGTHVSGTIGAEGNNALGVTGVNWDVSILPIRWIGPDNWGYLSSAVAAINYATMMRQNGVVDLKVTNNSWAWYGNSDPYQPAFDAITAHEQAGILFVAAAGNDNLDNDSSYYASYPATYSLPNIIAVAATDNFDQRAGFSNYGATSVDLAHRAARCSAPCRASGTRPAMSTSGALRWLRRTSPAWPR